MQSSLILDEIRHIPDYEQRIEEDTIRLKKLYRIPISAPTQIRGPMDLDVVEINGEKIRMKARSTARGNELREIAELEERIHFYSLALRRARSRYENLLNGSGEREFVHLYFAGVPAKVLKVKFNLSRPDRKMIGLIRRVFKVD